MAPVYFFARSGARTVLALLGILAFVLFSVTLANFLSADNMVDLLTEVAIAGIVAVPATLLIMSGQLDLSVGGTAALVGVVLAGAAPGVGPVGAVLIAIAAGALIGWGNGLLVTVAAVDSIPATFASMALLRGLAYLVPAGLTITLVGFEGLGAAEPVAGVAVPAVIFGAVAVIGGLLSRSAVGRRCRQIGRLPAAERCDGRADRCRLIAMFVVSGVSAALVGLILTMRLGAATPTAAFGLELTVVAAVLLGGGRLAGGRGSIGGTLVALVLICVVDNGFLLANVTPYAGQVFAAALLIIALVIDRPRGRGRNAEPPAVPNASEAVPPA